MERVVMITGASSGIGEAIAREYASRGARVALLARRVDRLAQVAAELGHDRALPVAADVRDESTLRDATARVLDHFGRLDVVVANAGIPMNGRFERLTSADFERQLDVNTFGVVRTVYATLDALKASRGAYGLVGSISGYISAPGSTAYSMSKYAVRALAEGLWAELRPYGISVTHIAPGFVESEIRSVDNRGEQRTDRPDPAPAWLVMPRAKAARQIVTAIDKRRREIVVTGHGKAAVALATTAPGLLHAVMRRVPPDIAER